MQRRNFLQLLGVPVVLPATTSEQPKSARRLFHSVQSGHWDDPLTWDVGEVPTPGSNVILLGHDIKVSRPCDVATVNSRYMSSINRSEGVDESIDESWERVLKR